MTRSGIIKMSMREQGKFKVIQKTIKRYMTQRTLIVIAWVFQGTDTTLVVDFQVYSPLFS